MAENTHLEWKLRRNALQSLVHRSVDNLCDRAGQLFFDRVADRVMENIFEKIQQQRGDAAMKVQMEVANAGRDVLCSDLCVACTVGC